MLIHCGRGTARLDCRLDCRPTGCVDLSVGLFQATASAASRRVGPPATGADLASGAGPGDLRRGVRHRDYGVSAGRIVRRRPSAAATAALAALVDRLASRIGRRSVLRPRLVPDAQPESAYRYDPLLEAGTKREKGKKRGGESDRERAREEERLLLRPLRLLPEPVPLVPWASVPHSAEGDSPIFVKRKSGQSPGFRSRGREYRVAHAWARNGSRPVGGAAR